MHAPPRVVATEGASTAELLVLDLALPSDRNWAKLKTHRVPVRGGCRSPWRPPYTAPRVRTGVIETCDMMAPPRLMLPGSSPMRQRREPRRRGALPRIRPPKLPSHCV